jgi:hypothetical protein
LPQVVAGPSTAARTFVIPVKEQTTLLRYRLQSRYYDIFKRYKKTPEKIPRAAQSNENQIEEAEETLGKSKGRKRKTFGVLENRIFPKMTKVSLEKDTKRLSEINESEAASCLLDCSAAIQRILTVQSASSLKSWCPVFFSSPKFIQQHMSYLTDGNDIFHNSEEHFEFQMELIFQYLLVKLPRADSEKVRCHN